MKYFIMLLILPATFCSGQVFREYNPLPDSALTKTVVGKRMTYTYLTYSVEGTGKILKVRQNKKMIFADEGEEGLKSYVPHIFLPADTNDFPVLMTDLVTESVSGFNLYLLNGIESVKIGYFPVAELVPGSDPDAENLAVKELADKILLTTDGTNMRISFTADKIVSHPGTGKEEVVDGAAVRFLYNGKKLKEVDEF